MMTITVNVPNGTLADDVASWADGAEYTLRVRQDGPSRFTVLEAMAAEPAEVVEEAPATATVPSRYKNPAIAAMMNKGAA